MKRKSVWLTTLVACLLHIPTGDARGQDRNGQPNLPRRAFLGVAMAPAGAGVEIRLVFGGSTAAALGLDRGDILVDVDGEAPTPTGIQRLISARAPGDTVRLTVRRGDELVHLAGVAQPYPSETFDGSRLELSSVSVGSERYRTMITVPDGNGARSPAVVFLQGIACGSIENPFGRPDGFNDVVRRVAAAGFITYRMDKPGDGDSEGGPCSSIGFNAEVDGFQALLRAVRSDSRVDQRAIFLFGHSMGGVVAPILASETEVAGVIVYGTIYTNIFEYLVENRRRQRVREAVDDPEFAARMRSYQEFFARLMFDKRTPVDIIDEFPELGPLGDSVTIFGRHYTFFQELYRTEQADLWPQSTGDVLAIHGEFDWVSAERDHRVIASAANPHGRSEYREIPGLDHWMTHHENLDGSYRDWGRGPITGEVADVTIHWMREVLADIVSRHG